MPETLDLVFMPDGRVINETNMDPGIPRVTGFVRYWIGADLGQANDFTSTVVIKDQQLPIHDGNKIILGPRERTVVYADKFKGVSYVAVVDHLIKLRNAKPFGGKSELVIDRFVVRHIAQLKARTLNVPRARVFDNIHSRL